MKFNWLCLILWAGCAAQSNETVKDYLHIYDVEDQVFLVKTLFTKLNTLLNTTDKLSESLLELTRRLDTQEKLMAGYLNQSSSWNTILRRQDGSVNFERNWNEYRNGFGNPHGEFFIGLEKLHAMTTYGPAQELLVVLKDFENQTRYANYDLFRVGSEAEKYAILNLGAYTGDAGNSFIHHEGHNFSTPDQDNDTGKGSCGVMYKSGWWFTKCFYVHLTGVYRKESELKKDGIHWNQWKGYEYSLKFAEMMIRPK